VARRCNQEEDILWSVGRRSKSVALLLRGGLPPKGVRPTVKATLGKMSIDIEEVIILWLRNS
jgi:hypothetical protein